MLVHPLARQSLIRSPFRLRLVSLPKFPPLSPLGSLRLNSTQPSKLSSKSLFDPSVWTVPNVLTYTRIIATPFIGYNIVYGSPIAALSLFTYSCVTDFIDGYIARRFNMKSVVGSIVDPLADKFLMTICTVSLAYVHSIPPIIATIIIGRDVMLSLMSFYYRFKSLAPPRTFNKFVSIGQYPTISVHPNFLGKLNTALQMLYIGSLVYRPLLESVVSGAAFDGLGLVVGATTLLSGANYVFNKNSWRYVK
ncbi:hypothetical protein KGF57_000653 [Candida theae]|uniref:Cardiolipin synthase n=1 Tax=Candida theae TaxID=1198502 RepID=A0AAD5BJ88_9ASCO|nr:uncharacterized protein KGF57_000653 [Candida theae]KAI5966689.1 hypothetical protein KGF57_000653 [Candida theae]